jgi:hypothetical protein
MKSVALMGRKLATLASKMGPRHIWRAESPGARKWRCHLMASNLRAQVPALAASDRVSSGTKRFCVFIAEFIIERLFFARSGSRHALCQHHDFYMFYCDV